MATRASPRNHSPRKASFAEGTRNSPRLTRQSSGENVRNTASLASTTARSSLARGSSDSGMPPPRPGKPGVPRHPAPFVLTAAGGYQKAPKSAGEPSPAVPFQKAPRLYTGGPLGLFPPTPTGPATPSPGIQPLLGVTPNGSAPMNFVPPMSPITPSPSSTPTPKTGSSMRSTRSQLSARSSGAGSEKSGTTDGGAPGKEGEGDEKTNKPPPKKRKRFSEQQVAILEAQLAINPTPPAKRLYELADELDDPEVCKDQVKVWFQNRRQKMKKLRLEAMRRKASGESTPKSARSRREEKRRRKEEEKRLKKKQRSK